jgi:hypothetical protein
MVAIVLAYRPKPKTKPARKRQRVRRRLENQTKLAQIEVDHLAGSADRGQSADRK